MQLIQHLIQHHNDFIFTLNITLPQRIYKGYCRVQTPGSEGTSCVPSGRILCFERLGSWSVLVTEDTGRRFPSCGNPSWPEKVNYYNVLLWKQTFMFDVDVMFTSPLLVNPLWWTLHISVLPWIWALIWSWSCETLRRPPKTRHSQRSIQTP